jgi:TonB family protein
MNRRSLPYFLGAVFLCAPCSAATFSGRVVTRDGKPVGGARVEAFATPIGISSVTRKQIRLYFSRGSTTTNRAGEFVLHATEAFADELIVAAKSGSAQVLRPSSKSPLLITLEPERRWTVRPEQMLHGDQFIGRTSVEDLSAKQSKANGTEVTKVVIRPDGVTTVNGKVAKFIPTDVFLDCSRPHYPLEAMRGHLTGDGVYRVFVNKQGRVTSVNIRKSTGHTLLDDTAINVISQWKAKPGQVREIDTEMTFHIR